LAIYEKVHFSTFVTIKADKKHNSHICSCWGCP